ncbi:conjugal transfer protein TraG N-terminal domain-containing protein [Geomonas subterranea]|uniref:conjugal transfer protein TraG N-terminal domain-containing protein n=1 Tax=Geomonas subterranea TaxID=2847989 RepID=UPI001CD588BD|nr:conjugal transfer protein TraG N-terminal domain-containing protein [Geomonas fuzhouensis]
MRKTVLLTLAFVILAASPAAAALNEYYTYGGFTPVTMAFENLARIFGDSAYKGAIGTFMLLGLALGVGSGYVKMAAGQGGPIAWVGPFLIGLILYMGFFVPKMNLAIYDPVYNQNKVIAGVPSGVVVISSIVNRLERFVVETFDTNAALPPNTACGPMSPMQYQQFGGAIGMRLMRSSSDQYVQSSDASQTLNSYINDCVVFELNRPGTTLTIDKLLTPGCGKTMLEVMGEANNPANFTTSYFGNAAGSTKTCAVVYDELTAYYSNPLNSNQPGANACAGTGFSDSARCQEILVTMLNASTGDSFDGSKFISNNTVASITNQALLSGGGASTTAYMTQINQAQSGSSSGFMAGIMNPYMIDAYVAYTLMLLPVLALFLVTPLWKNAFGLIISMIVWTCLLRCLDVITFHSWAAQYQMAAAAALKSSGMGIDAAMRLPMMSNQYLGTFASMRNSVFLLATAVSGALFKFGDSAMSRLADKATADHDGVKGAISDRGTAAKMAMDNAAGAHRASMMTALASGAHGWDNVGKGMAANEFGSAAAGAGAMSAFGGNVNSMMSGQSHTAMVNTAQSSARAAGVSEAQARGMGVNDAAAQKAVLDRMGTDGKLASWSAGLATDKNLGESKGFQAAHEAAKASGYTGSIQDFQKDMSKVMGEKGFADSQGWKSFVKDKFAGNESGAIQAATNVAAFQYGKHAGEVDQTMAGSGKGAVGAGVGVGATTGNSNLLSMASDSVRRAIADQYASDKIKNDPNLYKDGHVTDAGYAAFMKSIAGANQASFVDGNGAKKSVALDDNGNATMVSTLRDNTNRDLSGTSSVKDDTHKTLSGTSSVKDNSHKTLSGTSSVKDNSHRDLSGTSSVKDNTHKTLSGTSSVNDNSHRDLSGSSSVKDDTHRTLSGTSSVKDNTHKDLRGTSRHTDNSDVTLDGTSHRTDNLTSSVSGNTEEIHAGSTRIHGGTVVDGATTAAVGSIGEKVGLDRKNVEAGVGTVLNIASDVLPLAGAVQGKLSGRVEEGKEVIDKAKKGVEYAKGKLSGRDKPVRVDEAGRTITRDGSAHAPAGGGAPAPSAGGGHGNLGNLTNSSSAPAPASSGYGTFGSGAAHAPRPAARPAGNANLGGMQNGGPSVANNGGYGKVGTGAAKAPKPGGGGAPKAVRPAKIM